MEWLRYTKDTKANACFFLPYVAPEDDDDPIVDILINEDNEEEG